MTTALFVALELELEITADAMVLRLTLTNNGDTEAVVFNRIEVANPDGTVDFPADVAYVDFREPEGALIIRKAMLTMPEGLPVPAGYAPAFATSLVSGRKLTEVIRLPVPVAVMFPPRAAALAREGEVIADVEVLARVVVVEIGVLDVSTGLQLNRENPAFPEVMTVFPSAAATSGQQLLSKAFPQHQPLPVLDYRVVAP